MNTTDELPVAERVVAICAHPDDESFGLGAVISAFVERGTPVELVCLTHGEASTLGADALDLAGTRDAELSAACSVLGLAAVHHLGNADGRLVSTELDRLVDEVLPFVRPIDTLLVFDEGGITGHPDHMRATAVAVEIADRLDLTVLAWTLDLQVADALASEVGVHFVGRPAAEIDLRVSVDRRRQLEAMHCHASQLANNAIPARRLALTGDVEPLRFLRVNRR